MAVSTGHNPGHLHGGEHISFENQDFEVVQEGLARILCPKVETLESYKESANASSGQSVFYNPIQQFNRDLSVLAIKAFGQDYISCKQTAKINRLKRKQTADKRSWQTTQIDHDGPTSRSGMPNSLLDNGPIENPQASYNTAVESPTRGLSSHKKRKLDSNKPWARGNSTEQGISQGPADDEPNPAGLISEASTKPTKFKILDALSATGLRALRYAHEIPFASAVVAVDLSASATEAIDRNVRFNELEHKICSVTGNSVSHMHDVGGQCSNLLGGNPGKYDVIDLDPYGTAVPFLDAALQAISDNGMLCVTCTDAGVWASCGYPEKTFALYGGTPIKGLHSHEGGLRLILNAIATTAAKYGIAVEPLLSLSIDYYARVFVRVRKSPAAVKMLAGKTMLVFSCDSGCGAWETQYIARNKKYTADGSRELYKHSLSQGPSTDSHCKHCGTITHVSGPMYGGPLHNAAFIQAILDSLRETDHTTYATWTRIEGMLVTALEEFLIAPAPLTKDELPKEGIESSRVVPEADPAAIDPSPFFIMPTALAKVLRCQSPPEASLRGALRHSGYLVTRSHIKPGSIRTNAPWSFIWRMMKEWVRQHSPIKENALSADTPGFRILHSSSTDSENSLDRTQPLTKKATSSTQDNMSIDSQERDNSQVGEKHRSSRLDDTTETRPIVFDENLGREFLSWDKPRVRRYQINPRANWGPMSRAKLGKGERIQGPNTN